MMRKPQVIILEELADTTAATMATMAVTETRGRIFVTFSVKLENSFVDDAAQHDGNDHNLYDG